MSVECLQDRVKRVAMVHYHLEPGGVTTILEHAVEALRRAAPDWEIVVISGRPARDAGTLEGLVQTVPLLDYSVSGDGAATSEDLAEALEAAARRAFEGALPDVWHCHNHSLGKNARLPDALSVLASRGQRLLLQIHDFAEDGRPSNYRILQQASSPYPLGGTVHYATINGRDRQVLGRVGVAEGRLHNLPNPVAVPLDSSAASTEGARDESAECLLLYPTRGIRRKNMGEVLLLALLGRGHWKIATTRGPDNPEWQAIHQAWERFGETLDVPVAFAVVGNQAPAELEMGDEASRSFSAWLASARGFVTTSVAEGFGLTYLEALWRGTPLLGRDLPEITSDFKRAGLTFSGLYEAIRVPIDWVGKERLLGRLREELERVYRAYNVPLPEDARERALAAMIDDDGRIDFGRLDEAMQRDVLRRLVDENLVKQVMIQLEGEMLGVELWLDRALRYLKTEIRSPKAVEILQNSYSRTAYGRRLLACYEAVLDGGKSSFSERLPSGLDVRSRLVATFLSPERFHFLRS